MTIQKSPEKCKMDDSRLAEYANSPANEPSSDHLFCRIKLIQGSNMTQMLNVLAQKKTSATLQWQPNLFLLESSYRGKVPELIRDSLQISSCQCQVIHALTAAVTTGSHLKLKIR